MNPWACVEAPDNFVGQFCTFLKYQTFLSTVQSVRAVEPLIKDPLRKGRPLYRGRSSVHQIPDHLQEEDNATYLQRTKWLHVAP